MNNLKLMSFAFLVFYFTTVLAFGDSVTLKGTITRLIPCYDVDSPRFRNEYSSYNLDNTLPDSNFDAMEILVKKDVLIFDKYCIIADGYNILALKSNLTNMEALRSLPLKTFYNNTKEVLERFPRLIDAVNPQIEHLKRTLPWANEWSEPFVSYSVDDNKVYNNYIVIQFGSPYNTLGGILYILDSNGEIIQEKMLVEDISLPNSLYLSRVLSEERIVLFLETPPSFNYIEISVEPIIIDNGL